MEKYLKSRDINNFLEIKNCMIEVFRSIHKQLVDKTQIDCSFSGTTCSSILVVNHKYYSINVGDSRAIVAKY